MEAHMADIGKSTKSSAPGFVPAAFGETGTKQFEAPLEVQKELLGTFEEMNRAWLARAQSGVTLASELVSELATTRTIPDAAAACQKCMNRQMEMFAENSRQMFADSEKLMRAAARLFTNGSPALSS
jgi:hypothetical protein